MNKTTIMKWMVLPMALMAVACTDYQSSIDELDNRVDGIEQRVAKLESLNSQIAAIQQIVTAQEQAGYITGVAQNANGYQFTMSNGTIISVRDGIDGKDGQDGQNGQDGHTPVIGVTQDTDGNWYWTVDGEYLLDGSGNKVRANGIDGQNGTNGTNGQNGENGQNGQDGITPQLRINPTTGMWEVSYDNGTTWTSLGVKAQGENGQNGQNGENGQNGQDGVTPQLRINPTTGMWEVSYDNGTTWTSLGVKAQGENGQNGQNGENGQNGQDGITPQLRINTTTGMWEVSYDNGTTWTSLGVKAQGENGQNGQNGENGQNGQDGITPQLRINTTTLEWEVSLDNGATWTSLGVKAKGEDGAKGADGADGDAFFKSVTVGETEVTFTLADGVTTFTLPVMDTFKKVRDRVQSIVYIPENLDGMMTLQNGVQTTVRYRVMPEAVATALATNYASTLSFIGEEVAVTRGIASATIAIDGVVNEGNGRLAVSITPSGMTVDKGYAFALTMNDGTSMYSTAYTSVFFAIPPVAIGIAADGILAGQGYITVGNTLQLIPLLVPTTTNMKGVEWTTSDANVATVDANGQVIARNNGTATITVTSKAAPTVSKSITITVSDGSITLNTNDLVSQSNAE